MVYDAEVENVSPDGVSEDGRVKLGDEFYGFGIFRRWDKGRHSDVDRLTGGNS